jgi:hypothetical protein
MEMAARMRNGVPSAGLYAGPLAWMANTQANYSLVPWVCASKVQLVPVVALVLALVSLVGAYLSWRAWRTSPATPGVDDSASARPHRLIAGVGVLMSVLFCLVILLQGAAGFVFQGCER